MERSHEYKREKYAPLVAELSRHYRMIYYPVEISVRGQLIKENRFVRQHASEPSIWTDAR